MKKILIIILSVNLLICSCTNFEIYKEPANIILQNYGGEITYGEGTGIGDKENGNKYNYLSVELSNSQFLQYGISPVHVITHIATEFAKVAPKEIGEVQVTLNDLPTENGIESFNETIPMEELKLIISKESILHSCFDKIALDTISEFTPFLTEEFKTKFIDNKGDLVIKKINEMIGEYKGSVFRGYDLMGIDSLPNNEFILLNGLMLGTKQNADLSIIIDPKKSKNQCIVELRY